jgi:hypothetical protein
MKIFLSVKDDRVQIDTRTCLFKERIEDMKLTDDRIERYASRYKGSTCTSMKIMSHVFRNVTQDFFRNLVREKAWAPLRCDLCLRVAPLQRAHSVRTRPEIGLEALEWCTHGDCIIRRYLELHRDVPLWCLCTECHRKNPTWDGTF